MLCGKKKYPKEKEGYLSVESQNIARKDKAF